MVPHVLGLLHSAAPNFRGAQKLGSAAELKPCWYRRNFEVLGTDLSFGGVRHPFWGPYVEKLFLR